MYVHAYIIYDTSKKKDSMLTQGAWTSLPRHMERYVKHPTAETTPHPHIPPKDLRLAVQVVRHGEATGKRHATHWNPGAPALASLGLRMDMARGCLEKTANMVRECAGNAHERAGKASHIIIFASGNSKLPPNTKGGGN